MRTTQTKIEYQRKIEFDACELFIDFVVVLKSNLVISIET